MAATRATVRQVFLRRIEQAQHGLPPRSPRDAGACRRKVEIRLNAQTVQIRKFRPIGPITWRCPAPLAVALAAALLLAGRPAQAHEPLKASAADVKILPAQIALNGAQATQRLLVERHTGGQYAGDLSRSADFASSNPKVAVVDRDGTVRAVGNGAATIRARIGGLTAIASVRVTGVGGPVAWNFRNHVLPVLTKAGCNSGACHGAAAGKGGMKLSLRGFDPDIDYSVLTRQAAGRRIVAGNPAHSLFLLKPTMTLPHVGGRRIVPQSRDYRVLAGWVQAGAPRPRADDPRIVALNVLPSIATLQTGESQQILVQANYSDGHVEDVTRWVKFGSSDNTVATVDDMGQARMMGCGEAAITAWFSSKVAFARVGSPFPHAPAADAYRKADRHNFIDDLVLAKLQSLGIDPSLTCSDGEFIRRATLDSTGTLPTPAETSAFLADAGPDKRSKLVEKLLARPEFVDYWAYRWSDLFLVSSKKMSPESLKVFYAYLRQSVADNKPWNQLAREILTAAGSNLDNGAANYYVIHKDPTDLTETTTQAFLGMPLMCAHCHNHPLEKWTQRDYYQMANLFSRVRLKSGDRAGEVMVLSSADGNINLPRLGIPLPPRPLDGTEMRLDDPTDRRQHLADWLTAPSNPYFAKALVNRVWRNFMGRGLVESEDDVRLTNPPSNQELLDALAEDFTRNGYDIRHLIRKILCSAAYERTSSPTGNNARDDRYYSRYIVRRLPAEVILDAESQVSGVPTAFEGYPKGTRALQLPDSQVVSYFLTAFGRPERERTCACERQQEPNVAQALHLTNGDTVNAKLRADGGLIDRLLKSGADDDRALNEIYLAALSRLPSVGERRHASAILADTVPVATKPAAGALDGRRAVLEDLCWAVLTGNEFLFNH